MRALLAATLLLLPVAARAAGAPACGQRALPLVAGNAWAYKSLDGHDVDIRVLDVAAGTDLAGKPQTSIQVEETFGERTTVTVWTCTAAGLVVSPDSLIFAGEPGGGNGTTFALSDREEVTLPPDAQLFAGKSFVEKVRGDVFREDMGGAGLTHPAAQTEIERHVNVKGPTDVTVALGTWSAIAVEFDLRGRAIVGAEKAEFPIRKTGAIYYLPGVGVVRLDDAYGRTWELVATSLPLPPSKPKPAASQPATSPASAPAK